MTLLLVEQVQLTLHLFSLPRLLAGPGQPQATFTPPASASLALQHLLPSRRAGKLRSLARLVLLEKARHRPGQAGARLELHRLSSLRPLLPP